MAALAADRNTPMKDGELISVSVAAAVKIYAGSLVAVNASGYATPGALAATLTYLGRAEEQVDNTGADGAKSVLVRVGKTFKWLNHGADPVVQADLGKPCYIVDDQTVAKTNGNGTRSAAGTVIAIDSDGVWVAASVRGNLTATAALDFASIAAAASADLTIAVAGAAVGDAVSLGLPAAPTAGLIFQTFVSAAGIVTVRATNITAGAVDAASATYRVTVHKL
ncbi:hypothetical protein [Nitrosovibrio sp. Nv4]|uniref:hypothetical protein n=1 Tax=Nitrosovibrio sp. Nv4 TaxID=1945880 RepID=UPI000BD89BE6|nr:hypothetical protein [Nitrosovibrio sp. Nv4]SOD42323.1 hypothetical protein SAMN06298226_2662 [Nitrosovibrio sp. Nv4]